MDRAPISRVLALKRPVMDFKKLSSGSSSLLDFISGAAAQLVVIGYGISFTGIAPYYLQQRNSVCSGSNRVLAKTEGYSDLTKVFMI